MIAVEEFSPEKYAGVVKEISSCTIKDTEINEYLISPLLLIYILLLF